MSDFGKGSTNSFKMNSSSHAKERFSKLAKESFLKQFECAPKGSIMPVFKTIEFKACPIAFFSALSNNGLNENCILLESADIIKKYGEKSIASHDPCLKVTGLGKNFEIIALNSLGEKLLAQIAKTLSFCDSLKILKNKATGTLEPKQGIVSEQERLLSKTHADILRAIAFQFKPFGKKFPVSSGLFGTISYDFIDQFENLPKNNCDVLKDPDYEMLFLDSLFIVDHLKKRITLIANAFKTGMEDGKEISRCLKKIAELEKKLASLPEEKPVKNLPVKKLSKLKTTTDCSKKEYISIVKKCKRHIILGDVFQIVASRTTIAETNAIPLKIYSALRWLNPSPYMFYLNTCSGTLVGSSPETFIKVSSGKEKRLEIMPVAGTRPRGIVGGKIDQELDSRYENDLRTDKKELAEHTMLVDLARNDVARVCIPGTRIVDKVHYIEKYSNVMHLVSNVSGILKPGLDALHAYLASMNMGTLTGAPKVKAMELLRKYEKEKRGFYGGSIGYLTPDGSFDSAIVIRSMRLKKGKAHIRTGGGIVFDSIPEKEFDETCNKAKSCLNAISQAEGLE